MSESFPTHDQAADRDRHRQGVRRLFDIVAPRYDLMNDLMSFGIHRLWKRRVVRAATETPPGRALDLAGGTGDIARLLSEAGFTVVVADPSVAMMRAGGLPEPRLSCIAAAGEALPFADGSLALVTVGFGLRNMTDRDAALRECLRVLAPGGLFLCLEFSRPAPWLAPAYDLYSRFGIPLLGAAVAGKRQAYRYLVESIREFPDQQALKDLMIAAGFAKVSHRNLSFGIAALHAGSKPAAA